MKSLKGEKSVNIKPIETEYNGYRFRSRLEARWAVFFDAAGIKYEYEPEGYVLEDGTPYLPDFYLPELKAFVEIKRANLSDDEREKAEDKCRALSDGKPDEVVLLCSGDPVDMDIMIFCGVWDYTLNRVVPWEDVAWFSDGAVWFWFAKDETILCGGEIGKVSIVAGEKRDIAHNKKLPIIIYHPQSIIPSSLWIYERGNIDECSRKAREARFEYGENHRSKKFNIVKKSDSIDMKSIGLITRDKMLDLVNDSINGNKSASIKIILYMKKAERAEKKGIIHVNPYKGIAHAEHLHRATQMNNAYNIFEQ